MPATIALLPDQHSRPRVGYSLERCASLRPGAQPVLRVAV